jgi:hypothetical protein
MKEHRYYPQNAKDLVHSVLIEAGFLKVRILLPANETF